MLTKEKDSANAWNPDDGGFQCLSVSSPCGMRTVGHMGKVSPCLSQTTPPQVHSGARGRHKTKLGILLRDFANSFR